MVLLSLTPDGSTELLALLHSKGLFTPVGNHERSRSGKLAALLEAGSAYRGFGKS